jgi:hypothetical protein
LGLNYSPDGQGILLLEHGQQHAEADPIVCGSNVAAADTFTSWSSERLSAWAIAAANA